MAPIAALIAHVAFWCLLVYGWASHDLGPRGILVFLFLWALGLFGLPYVPYGAGLFSSFVAVLDIVLVFLVLKQDVRIT